VSGGAPAFPAVPDPLPHWRYLAPARTALVDRRAGTRLTYAELDACTARWCALLAQQGVRRGDRVGLMSGNRHESIALLYACGRLGAALVPWNWRLAAAELAPIVADSAVRLAIGEGKFRAALEQADPTLRWLDVDDDAPRMLERAGGAPPPVRVDAEDPWLVLYTSGSTGRPKGAMLPHRQLFWNAVATTTGWELSHHDVFPITTPLFHTGGWNVFATPGLQVGGTIVMWDRFEPADFLAGMAEERCTVALTVPTQLVMLLESPAWGQPLPALRSFFSGGAACPPSVLARVRDAGYALREGYGLTECGPNCFAISAEESVANPGRVGRPIPFLEMRLVTDDGRDAAVDEPGELWLRGPQRFSGYLHAPELTAEAITPDGWLRTGDLATRDAQGLYGLCGRRKEMYISGGENVFPVEVEAAIADCPGVAEVVVVGVPDERWGEVGRAFVVCRTGERVTEDAVLRHARGRLAGYKVPKGVVILAELPRLGSGKADRRALAALAPAPSFSPR
jgi:fatty-acyl-CoA synthase